MVTDYLKLSFIILLVLFLVLFKGLNIYSIFLLILFISSLILDKSIKRLKFIEEDLTVKELIYLLKCIIVCCLVVFIELVLSGFDPLVLILYGAMILIFYYVSRHLELRLLNKL